MAGGDQRLTMPAGPLYTHDRLAAGDLPMRVREVWPLERAAEAHRAVERGERGRAVPRVAPAEPS